jgi:hypothetical protein
LLQVLINNKGKFYGKRSSRKRKKSNDKSFGILPTTNI